MGKVGPVPEKKVLLHNGRFIQHFILKNAVDIAALRAAEGKWVRMDYTQANTAGYQLPIIQDIKLTILHDAKNPFPLRVVARPGKPRLPFGDRFSFTCRLSNTSDRPIAFGSRLVFPYLKAKGTQPYEVALRAPSDRPGYPGLWFDEKTLGPNVELKNTLVCSNLIMPGRYDFRIESPSIGGIRTLSDPIEIEVTSPGNGATERTLVEWMDKATFPQKKGIAWILWRDFDNHTGMEKLTEIMEEQEHPHHYTAGIIAAAEGRAAVEPFLRAIRKEKIGGNVHYWCEQACHSRQCLVLFKSMLQENSKVRYGEAADRPIPISQLVAQFLIYYWNKDKKFTWAETDEHREQIVAKLQKMLDESPKSIRLFDGKHAFDPASIDGLMRKGMYWGSY